MNQQRLPLPGCAPIPLAHYLKALGILRLVAEDREHGDPAAAGCWDRDVFILHSRFDREGLLNFFLHHYQPTPILAPWNGGSGFFSKDNTLAIKALENSSCNRLANYRAAIAAGRRALAALSLKEKPNTEEKEALLQECRNLFPESALPWLDAAFVLTSGGAKYPPLLGTGGNDGRLEFTNNSMQRLVEIIDTHTGAPKAKASAWLPLALFGGVAVMEKCGGAVGQFFPGAAGGVNGTSGFLAGAAINPWDYVLMLEGAALFAAAAVRRLEEAEPGALIYPFCVRQSGVGYASAALGDEQASRAEIWLPMWSSPTALVELLNVFSEGRAQVGRRAARTGVDFARAVVCLGVDRGISAFQRVGFQVRNGLSYFATPLDRFEVRRNARADLLSEADHWLEDFRRAAGPNAKQVPAGVSRALALVEIKILDLCKEGRPERLLAVLTALGGAERALARSITWTTGRNEQPPVQKCAPLSGLSARWLREADDGSIEFRLAAALASVSGIYKNKEGRSTALPLRRHLEPVAIRSGNDRHWFAWDDPPSNDTVWHEGDFVDVLNAVFARRLVRAGQAGKSELPDAAQCFARLDDIVAFIEGRTDDDLLAHLLWGLSLLDWKSHFPHPRVINPGNDANRCVRSHEVPSALFSILRLAFPRPGERGDSPSVPIVPMIHRLAAIGNGLEASRLAVRRLRGSGLHPALNEVFVTGDAARRVAAAILFPLSRQDFARLGELVCKPQTDKTTKP